MPSAREVEVTLYITREVTVRCRVGPPEPGTRPTWDCGGTPALAGEVEIVSAHAEGCDSLDVQALLDAEDLAEVEQFALAEAEDDDAGDAEDAAELAAEARAERDW